MHREYNGKMVNMGFYYTNIPLRLTPEHPVLCIADLREPQSVWRFKENNALNEDNLKWLPANQFTDHSFIAFPRLLETQDMELMIPELCELIGWYVSEGNVDKSNGAITISLGRDKPHLIMRVVYLINHLFGREPGVDDGGTATRITFGCEPFAALLKQFGQGATHKTIPSWFMKLPHAKQYAFLRGYILGDGCFSEYFISATTSSEHLAYKLRLMLYRLGIIHGLKQREVPDTIIDGRIIHATAPRNDITISGDGARMLDRGMGLCHDFGERTSGGFAWVGNNYILIPAQRIIEEQFAGTVYNISVDQDESYLTVHGVAHNCLKHLGAAGIALREGYERANDGNNPDSIAEKVMECLNEHAGMELDLDAMKASLDRIPASQRNANSDEAMHFVEKMYSGIRAFRAAAWQARLPTMGGSKDEISDARVWNDMMFQEMHAHAKSHPGAACVLSGM